MRPGQQVPVISRSRWNFRGPRGRTCLTALLACVLSLLALATPSGGNGVGGLLAQAGAYATPAPAPAPVVTPGLPDGRIYEQVSPFNKHGNYVASGGLTAVEENGYAAARADGNALALLGSGAMGEASSSVLGPYVARRSSSGWSTASATPPQLGLVDVFGSPTTLIPSQDFSAFVFGARFPYSPAQPSPGEAVNLYLAESAFAPPSWLGSPEPGFAHPFPKPGDQVDPTSYLVTGASSTLGVVYFTYAGTLVKADEARAPNIPTVGGVASTQPWGFYEWTKTGGLSSAGVLPDGTVSAFGAVPAALGPGDPKFGRWQAADFSNEVSADGSMAFFVSPDPVASSVSDGLTCGLNAVVPCTSAPPELYVREALSEGRHRATLLSGSQRPGHEGEPAPHGVMSVESAVKREATALGSPDVYVSPDGKQAFFASADPLTSLAPNDSSVKEYAFNLDTKQLTYLPGVIGPIVASARDGSGFLFKNTATVPEELDLWSGPGAGTVRALAQLPTSPLVQRVAINVEARASADGSVFVFNTNSPIPGFANNSSGFRELYRYDVVAGELACLSCAPAGVTPVGDVHVSYNNRGGSNSKPRSTLDTRVISADGSRVFFDSPDPLVPLAANGRRGVYEWERGGVGGCHESRGCLYLLSSGTGSEDAFYLDNSESGSDVFFNTSAGLLANDLDGAYDAYDARTPHPGDQAPPTAPAPCEGATCQSPSSVPELATPPASATVAGSGSLPESQPAAPVRSTLTRHQKLSRALRACRAKRRRHSRASCEKTAHRRFGSK